MTRSRRFLWTRQRYVWFSSSHPGPRVAYRVPATLNPLPLYLTRLDANFRIVQSHQDTPEYTVSRTQSYCATKSEVVTDTPSQDSDTNPNTTASSVAGDASADVRKRKTDTQLRRSLLDKKQSRLDQTKVRTAI